MKVVIMAGGKGTRISSIASDIPKPMIQIAGKSILEHQIECLKNQELTDIVIVTGHLGEIIKDYFGNGERFKVNITYYHETAPLGTAGALFYLKDILKEDFILLNGDILFDIDFKRFISYHNEKGGLATLFTHPNSHPYDSALIVSDKNNKIIGWLHKEEERNIYKNRVNAGMHILSPKLINFIGENKKTDLDREILKPLIKKGFLYAYDSPEYAKDMGTPERYKSICEDFITGRVKAKNISRKQKAIFLDRDGTINENNGFITRPEQIKLIPNAAEAIKKINSSGYLAILITNQPVIARGECTLEELEEINNKLETLLGEDGAYLDAIYFCPHHPDKGFEGERVEYKMNCECRKPKPGLILKAAQEYNIDLSKSYMVGDSLIDVEAGKAAGCRSSIYINSNENDDIDKKRIESYTDLMEFIKTIV